MRSVFIFGVLLLSLVAETAGAATAADAVRGHGTAVIRTQQYETLVVIRTSDGDGPADHVFHLWAKPALQVDGGWRNVGVEFIGTALSLTFPDMQKTITFTVAGASAPGLQIPDGFAMTGYTVAGLSHEIAGGAARHAMKTASVTPYSLCNCDESGFESPDPWNATGGGGCTSGGMGATSCSQTAASGSSCTVTCGTGMYACCVAGDPPSCTCR